MSKDVAELVSAALRLSTEARAVLAESLLESLDSELDPGAEEAWRQEIQQRLHDIDSGVVKLISWPDALRHLQSRLER